MAARRLVIIMIVLLVISTVVAIIAPPAAERERGQTEPTTRSEPDDPGWHDGSEEGRLHSFIDSSSDEVERIEALTGDVLLLRVGGGEARQISLPELGLYGTQSPSAPATFEVLLRNAGAYRVIDAKTEEMLAKIAVNEPGP